MEKDGSDQNASALDNF